MSGSGKQDVHTDWAILYQPDSLKKGGHLAHTSLYCLYNPAAYPCEDEDTVENLVICPFYSIKTINATVPEGFVLARCSRISPVNG